MEGSAPSITVLGESRRVQVVPTYQRDGVLPIGFGSKGHGQLLTILQSQRSAFCDMINSVANRTASADASSRDILRTALEWLPVTGHIELAVLHQERCPFGTCDTKLILFAFECTSSLVNSYWGIRPLAYLKNWPLTKSRSRIPCKLPNQKWSVLCHRQDSF